MMNVEKTVIDWLAADEQLAECAVYADVPAERPERFVTVELTGGAIGRYKATRILAVCVYAPTRYEASRLANDVLTPRLQDMPWGVSEVADVSVESMYSNPMPGPPPQPRYQINITIIHAM